VFDVWTAWAVVYRDVIVVDADNQIVGVYNLTTNDLGMDENRRALEDLILSAVIP